MYCRECGAENEGQANFCIKCGSPLVGASQGNEVLASASTKASWSSKVMVVLLPICIVCTLLVVGILVWAFLLRPVPDAVCLPVKDGVALFVSDTRLVEGKDGTAHLRVRAPKDTSQVVIKDGNGLVLATLGSDDMEDEGDGGLWADVDVSIPGQESGAITLSAVSVHDSQNDSSDAGEKNQNGQHDTVDNQIVTVVPDGLGNPVPASSSWILADTCDWFSKSYGDKEKNEDAANALAEYLNKDSRVKDVQRYGKTVLFTTKKTDDGEGTALHCICLESASSELLGSGDDHVFSQTGTPISVYSTFESEGRLTDGLGITSGNTVTSGDVLLLEPTPGQMQDSPSKLVKQAGDKYADALGGTCTVKEGDDALRSLLGGDLYGSGVVVLRAHGIEVQNAGTSLIQMRANAKNADTLWEDMRKNLHDYIGGLTEYSSVPVGDLFFASAKEPKTWRCAVAARIAKDSSAWDVGVSVTPSLIQASYAERPLDQCVLWLSTCGGLADASFNKWASSSMHGIQVFMGYGGMVSQTEDANNLSNLLDSLAAKTSDGDQWRCMNVGEAMGESMDLLRTQSDESPLMVNPNMFSKGVGSISGHVLNKDGAEVSGAVVNAWRYFGNSFAKVKEAKSSEKGAFQLVELPCGRYVLDVRTDKVNTLATIVLDEKAVDGGSINLGIEQKKPASQQDKPAEPESQKPPVSSGPEVPDTLDGQSVVWSNVADYDGDGRQEAFAIVGEWFGTAVANSGDVWTKPSLWFISSSGEARRLDTYNALVYINGVFADPAGSGYTLMSLETTSGGSGSNSHVFGVRNGAPVKVNSGGRDIQLYNGMIIAGHSFFASGGGHREEWFEATLDTNSFQLVEGQSLGTKWLRELP